MIVFAHSTLGFQAIAKGIKCAVFMSVSERCKWKISKKKGPFWTNSKSYQDFENF